MSDPVTFNQAVTLAVAEEMRGDDSVVVLGTGITRGAANRDLTKEFGRDRLIEAPLAEQGFTCAGLGLAMMGRRPIVTFGRGDFLFCAMDSIVNEAAKYRYMCGGDPFRIPMVMKVQSLGMGGGAGAQHVQNVEGTFMHFPGLKIAIPSTPSDAYGLLKSAIRDDNPVIFFEHKQLRDSKASEVLPEDDDFVVSLGQSMTRRFGGDVTIVTYANMVAASLEAAEILDPEGISVEVIDLRSLLPWDREAVLASVERTGRLLTVTEDTKTGGVGSEIAATVAEEAFDSLQAPIRRVSYPDMIPPSTVYGESLFRVGVDDVVAAVRELVRLS